MAIDSEPKRWSMLQVANGPAFYSHLINPTGSNADSAVERASFLKLYGGLLANPSVAASGTLDGATEAQIVTGGRTLILTLTNDTWVTAGATFNAQRQNIIDGVTSAQTETFGWNNEVRDNEVVTSVVRTSDTVVTITWSAAPNYDITANETITVTVPATALTSGVELVALENPTITAIILARKGGRVRRPPRWLVEVDGQLILARTQDEAIQLLGEVTDLVEEQAPTLVEKQPKAPRITVKTGSGTVSKSKPVTKAVKTAQRQIDRAYDQALAKRIKEQEMAREISQLLHAKLEQEDFNVRAMLLL